MGKTFKNSWKYISKHRIIMKTKNGFITNGSFVKYKSGFTDSWCVELENSSSFFKNEEDADMFILSNFDLHNHESQIFQFFMIIDERLDKTSPIRKSSSWKYMQEKYQLLKSF